MARSSRVLTGLDTHAAHQCVMYSAPSSPLFSAAMEASFIAWNRASLIFVKWTWHICQM